MWRLGWWRGYRRFAKFGFRKRRPTGSKLYENPAGDMSETKRDYEIDYGKPPPGRRFRKDTGTAESDRERAMLMAPAHADIERPTTPFSRTSRRFDNAALQPVPRHDRDHLTTVRDRGRRGRGKRLRAGAKASALAADPGAAVIQARPSDASTVANTRISPGIKKRSVFTVYRIQPTSVTIATRSHRGTCSIPTLRSSHAAPGNRELSS